MKCQRLRKHFKFQLKFQGGHFKFEPQNNTFKTRHCTVLCWHDLTWIEWELFNLIDLLNKIIHYSYILLSSLFIYFWNNLFSFLLWKFIPKGSCLRRLNTPHNLIRPNRVIILNVQHTSCDNPIYSIVAITCLALAFHHIKFESYFT